MTKMKQWLISIIAVSVSAGIIELLLPSGKTKKTFYVVSGIVMMYVFLIPLKNADINAVFKPFTSDSKRESESLQSQYDMTVISAFEKGVMNTLNESFKAENIQADCKKVECESVKDEIHIRTITVRTGKSDKAAEKRIREIIGEKIKGNPKIEITGG